MQPAAVLACARLLAVPALAVALAGCGGGGGNGNQAHRPLAIERLAVGSGASGATVLRPARAPARLPVVVFLHGWGAVDPEPYLPWLRHLVGEGNAVIYPTYQASFLSLPGTALPSALAGIRAGLRRVRARESSLVVAGHSAGGALSADYAAIAARAGLPPARAVLAVYPGRSLRGMPLLLGPAGPVPRRTALEVLVGADDETVGSAAGREIVRLAGHGRLVVVRDPRVDDHLAPTRDSAPARQVFWARLDALIAKARR